VHRRKRLRADLLILLARWLRSHAQRANGSRSADKIAAAGFKPHNLRQRYDRHWRERNDAKDGKDDPFGFIGVHHGQNPISASATRAATTTGNPIAPMAIEMSESMIRALRIKTS
jgi:hypothetical protein